MTAADGSATGAPDYRALTFPAPPAGRPYVIVNMVTSVDGRAVIEGTERGLGSAADRRLMRELRSHADVVVVGAGTLRASGSSSRLDDAALQQARLDRGQHSNPLAAVISRSGALPLERAFFTADDFEAVVYLSASAPAERRAAIESTGRPVHVVPAEGGAAAALRHMGESLGARLVLCEGGPTLNGELFAAGLVDEYFTTVGPLIVSGREPRTPVESGSAPSVEGAHHLELISAVPNPHSGELYLRYRVRV